MEPSQDDELRTYGMSAKSKDPMRDGKGGIRHEFDKRSFGDDFKLLSNHQAPFWKQARGVEAEAIVAKGAT